MYDATARSTLLYVGKARNLRNRVSSYFRNSGLNAKTVALVMRIRDIQVTVTSTEADALLLEQNLIKAHKPPYNILLRDDKSYPYIFLSSEDRFPRLALHRGRKRRKGSYFGPYPERRGRAPVPALPAEGVQGAPVRGQLLPQPLPALPAVPDRSLHGALRGSRVGEDYAEQVEKTVLFLQGKSRELLVRLADDMEQAAAELAYERAAELRDQIQHLQQVQSTRASRAAQGDLDVVAVAWRAGAAACRCCSCAMRGCWAARAFTPRCASRRDPRPRCSRLSAAVLPARRAAHPRRDRPQPCPENAEHAGSVFSDPRGGAYACASACATRGRAGCSWRCRPRRPTCGAPGGQAERPGAAAGPAGALELPR
jgi:hypothetical protein